MAIEPKIVSGTIKDVKHIVVLMQENRSFDHYLGSLRGVRGFDDPRAVTLPSGNPVFQQPNGANTLLPFRPPQPFLGYQFVRDLPHNWSDAHGAWNNGNNNNRVAAKGSIETMTFVDRNDIPFHYALADAFRLRQLPLFGHGSDRPEPLLPMDRMGRPERHAARHHRATVLRRHPRHLHAGRGFQHRQWRAAGRPCGQQ